FDGRSAIYEINKSGIALVFSSEAHKDAELMSARLCESAAAGAVIIADNHPFARRHFGDALLYVEPDDSEHSVARQVIAHLEWIKSHPDEALKLAHRAQAIFKEKFLLTGSLAAIYNGLHERKAQLRQLRSPADDAAPVTLYFLIVSDSPRHIDNHLESFRCQDYAGCRPVFVIDASLKPEARQACQQHIEKAFPQAKILFLPLLRERFGGQRKQGRQRFGRLMLALADLDEAFYQQRAVGFVGPYERIFSQHVSALVAAMARNNKLAAYSDLLCRHKDGNDKIHHDLYTRINLQGTDASRPQGHARFLFAPDIFRQHMVQITLPYLDFHASSWLALSQKGAPSLRATTIAYIQESCLIDTVSPIDQEQDIMNDVTPELLEAEDPVLTYKSAFMQKFMTLSFDDKRLMFSTLFRTIPIPKLLEILFIDPYRRWARFIIRRRNK
ncbi:MAG TPA: hypothetical protein VHB73_00910, partial [Alphaproteobacteria bacterium]|nr:hypothetical protein [Alphaproteobacteria bacterium]